MSIHANIPLVVKRHRRAKRQRGEYEKLAEAFKAWQSVADFPLIYQKKPNEGKHIAINQGVDLADTALFFIVDSDDYLTADATLKIADYYPKIKDAKDLAGMSFRRGTDSKTYIGSPSFSDEILSVFEFRYQLHRVYHILYYPLHFF